MAGSTFFMDMILMNNLVYKNLLLFLLILLLCSACTTTMTNTTSNDSVVEAETLPVNDESGSIDDNSDNAQTNPNSNTSSEEIEITCTTDDDYTSPITWYGDADGDSYGSISSLQVACNQPDGYVLNFRDCNDNSADANLEELEDIDEVLNGYDDNCNGILDEVLLASEASVYFTGVVADDDSGYFVVTGGDINGDGYIDFALVSSGESTVADDAGAVYIFYSPISDSGEISLADADLIIYGEIEDGSLGKAMSIQGDINGDGYQDIMMASQGISSELSYIYIFYGKESLLGTYNAMDADVVISEADDNDISSALSTGDINGDGYDDILASSANESATDSNSGAVYLFLGASDLDNNISADDNHAKLSGDSEKDYAGRYTKIADINGDGYGDAIITASGDDNTGALAEDEYSNYGAIYIVYGPINSDIVLNHADVKIIGESYGDEFGDRINVGDINQDGFADILVGAEGSESAYLFYGSDNLAPETNAFYANTTFQTDGTDNARLCSIDIRGDFNGDGLSDVFLTKCYDDSNGSNAGAVYVFFNDGSLIGNYEFDDADIKLMGDSSNDKVGYTMGVADFNADNYADILIGAPGHNSDSSETDTDTGTTYLIYGESFDD